MTKEEWESTERKLLYQGAGVHLKMDCYSVTLRVLRHKMKMVISTEWTMLENSQIDEAIAGRIMQMSKGYRFIISKDQKKNYRLRE